VNARNEMEKAKEEKKELRERSYHCFERVVELSKGSEDGTENVERIKVGVI
jgi:hypothetical protein